MAQKTYLQIDDSDCERRPSDDLQELLDRPESSVRFPAHWRSAAIATAVLLIVGIAVSVAPSHDVHANIVNKDLAVQQKFYDSKDAYWQESGRGISTSEVWNSCKFPHMSTCNGYCCCDDGYYWKSPKTVYGQGKHIALSGVAAAEHAGGEKDPEKALKSGMLGTAKALGHAAFTAMMSPGQKCIPKAEVPADVLKELEKLHGGAHIPGSDTWIACSTFTPKTYECGNGHFCCCEANYTWCASTETCNSATETCNAAAASNGDVSGGLSSQMSAKPAF